MTNLNSLQEIARAIRNLIRTGIVTDVDHDEGLCRVQTGGMETTAELANLPRRSLARMVGSIRWRAGVIAGHRR